MFKKYGHFKSRLDEKAGDWSWGIWWQAKFNDLDINYIAHLIFTHKAYFPINNNIVKKFELKILPKEAK